MRSSIKKHYQPLARFVDLANLGWEEIDRHDEFPTLAELQSRGRYRGLLRRIDRAFEARFAQLRPAAEVPPFFYARWRECGRSDWRRIYAFALVRRLFDTLGFLTGATLGNNSGAQFTNLLLQVGKNPDGTLVRVLDPFEDFLGALAGHDLRRVRSCLVCRRFFLAWRLDQKACGKACANRYRVAKFRKQQAKYAGNRRFRKRTGLRAVRHGRRQLLELAQALGGDKSDSER